MNRRAAPFKTGTPVFHMYSMTIGTFISVWTPPTRLGEYTPPLAIVEVVTRGNIVRRVRWRLENCRKYTPRSLRSRKAFMLLARVLCVPSQRLRPRVSLWKYGFTRGRRREYCERVRRACEVKVFRRTFSLNMTCNQVVAAVLAAPKTRSSIRPKRRS